MSLGWKRHQRAEQSTSSCSGLTLRLLHLCMYKKPPAPQRLDSLVACLQLPTPNFLKHPRAHEVGDFCLAFRSLNVIDMEVVGGVAGVLQLVQAVGLLANGIFTTCQKLHHAPREFRDLELQISWIRCHLKSCENTLATVDPALLTQEIELSLTLALTDASSCFLELQRLVSRIQDVFSFDSRIKWAAHDRSKAAGIFKRLEDSRKRIESALHLLNL